MNTTKITTLLACAACAIIGLSAHAQNLLINGGFESPAIPANAISATTPASWQGSNNPSILNGNYGLPEYPGPQNGQQYAAIGGGTGIGLASTLSQAFTIINPGTYVLRWFDNAGDHPEGSPYSVVVVGPGGAAVANTTNNASHFVQGWLPRSIQLNLSPGTYALKFHSLGNPFGLATLLDNVSLQSNLLLNGSFESPSIPANTISATTPTSWQGSNNPPILNGNYGIPEYPGPQDSQQYAAIGGGTGIGLRSALSQAFTIMHPGTYVLRWFDNSGNHPDTSPYSVTLLNGAAAVVASMNFDASHFALGWVSRSVQLTLNSGTYVLQLNSLGNPFGLATLLDNVSLQTDNSDLLLKVHTSAVDICWAGFTNQMYQVQYRTNLSDTNWFNLGSPVQGTGTNCVTDWITSEVRYYRTVRLP